MFSHSLDGQSISCLNETSRPSGANREASSLRSVRASEPSSVGELTMFLGECGVVARGRVLEGMLRAVRDAAAILIDFGCSAPRCFISPRLATGQRSYYFVINSPPREYEFVYTHDHGHPSLYTHDLFRLHVSPRLCVSG